MMAIMYWFKNCIKETTWTKRWSFLGDILDIKNPIIDNQEIYVENTLEAFK